VSDVLGENYTYDHLIQKPDISVEQMPSAPQVYKHKALKIRDLARIGMNNVLGQNNPLNDAKHAFVENVYTGKNIQVTLNGIMHGMVGKLNRIMINARAGAIIGNLGRVRKFSARRIGIEKLHIIYIWYRKDFEICRRIGALR
jgi:hypothetical protein